MKKYINLFILIFSTLLYSCSDMDETYNEYTDFGKLRYPGKCKNLTVQKGWERCVLNWENSNDNTIKNIKLSIINDSDTTVFILPPDATSFDTKTEIAQLENSSYIFVLNSIDINGAESLPIENFGRPYSHEHEQVISFSKLEDKFFYLNNKIYIFLADKNEKINEAKIKYIQSGEQKEIILTDEIYLEDFIEIENIDENSGVLIGRSANIDDCIDPINFQDYELDRSLIRMNPDLSSYLKTRYFLSEISESSLSEINTLNLDLDFKSFVDLLYFNNLNKIVLGGKRYFDPSNIMGQSLINDDEKARSVKVLKILQDQGIIVEIYNNNYDLLNDLNELGAGLSDMGNPVLPDNYTWITNPGGDNSWGVSTNTDEYEYNSHPERLADNDASTVWYPQEKEGVQREHSIAFDMLENKEIDGFLFRQAPSFMMSSYFPTSVKIFISTNNVEWEELFANLTYEVGMTASETTLINLEETKTARYIKIKVSDRSSFNRNSAYFADFIPFKIN